MITVSEEYIKARKQGLKAKQKAVSTGNYPYLPALDDMLEKRSLLKTVSVGTREIPLQQVVGTVTRGRQEAFACNFMPLLESGTEFSSKWISLLEYQINEGIQDAVVVTEYMGKFYVTEGNKRVSVMKYLEMPTILAKVTRVLPKASDDPEVAIYNEFLKFYRCTQIYDIIFTEEGSYDKLAEALNKDYENVWDEDSIKDLKSVFFKFSRAYQAGGGKVMHIGAADAFLVYLEMYKFSDLIDMTEDEMKKSLTTAVWAEIRLHANGHQIAFSEEPQTEKKAVIPIIDNLFSKQPYNEQHPLNILFIYDGDATKSRWINGHEEGRKELENAFPGIVKTLSCDLKTTEEEFDEAVEAAVEDGVELIITTSPVHMENAVRAAIKYPNIKFLNCSVNLSHGVVRTYYGRMYEAKFLLGVIAATLSKDHRIGYVASYPIYGSVANINAFAIGAAMIDPEAKIYITWTGLKGKPWREFVSENNLKIVSGPDLIRPTHADNAYGLYSVDDNGEVTNIAFPELKWGKYYEFIVQTILNDAWNVESDEAKDKALNYWWGMSSGVIDVDMCEDVVSYETRKLIKAMKKTITLDICTPFDGELWGQDGIITGPDSGRLTNEEIVKMNWLNDNVVGRIPSFDDLTEAAQKVVKSCGMPILWADDTEDKE